MTVPWSYCCCSLVFNFNSAGSSLNAPPLPAAAQEDGWWNVDHARIKVSKQTALPVADSTSPHWRL
jgi:hypothetical protein